MQITVRVPATCANLGPGFDILALALKLENEIQATMVSESRTVSIDPGDHADARLRDPNYNLITIAFEQCAREIGVAVPGMRIEYHDNIPAARGLGSSAAAIVAGVSIAAHFLQVEWDDDDIIERAAKIEGHRDNVAAAVLGGLCISPPDARPETIGVPDDLRAVVFIPDQEMKTEQARKVVPASFSREDAIFNASRCALWVRAMATREYENLSVAMQDRWHQERRFALMPVTPKLIAAAVDAGAYGASLSGAGPSVIAICSKGSRAIAQAMCDAAAATGMSGRATVYPLNNEGMFINGTL